MAPPNPSKAALNRVFDAWRVETEVKGLPVSYSTLTLGLIGTAANAEYPGLTAYAMPVPDCAREMLHAIDRREREAFIPQYLSPYVSLVHFWPSLSDTLSMRHYIEHVPELLSRLVKSGTCWGSTCETPQAE